MEQINLPSTVTLSQTETLGSFSVEPLFPGYGSTLGNAMRRVLLSSLEGAAVDSVEIEGIQHEFSAIPNVKEDVIGLLLNLKMLRFRLQTDEATITLSKKGKGSVTGADFDANADCEVVNVEQVLATMDEGADLQLRVIVKRGRGYEPVDKKEGRSKTVGVITTDSIYSPISAVSYHVENTRVGQMTNYDKLLLNVQTDGSIMPAEAVKQAAQLLAEQYSAIAGMESVPVVLAETEADDEPTVEVTMDQSPLDPKTRIEDSGLSGRTANALLAAGYKTLSGLKRLSEIKLQSIKGLGAKGVDEVRAVLARVD
jgi:DNA-directed RNA polymerase subunit alpha